MTLASATNRLVVFTRFPRPGYAKTRLIPRLGSEGAAELQRAMTRHALRRIAPALDVPTVELEVRYTDGDAASVRSWLVPDVPASTRFAPQSAGDLGARMLAAFTEAFDEGIARVAILGVDVPAVRAGHIEQMFEALADHDLALGPAVDGGYWIIGMTRAHAPLFADMPWGTDRVFGRTSEIAARLALRVHLLETLRDVDEPEDLDEWERERDRPSSNLR